MPVGFHQPSTSHWSKSFRWSAISAAGASHHTYRWAGAGTFGCLLHLCGHPEGARFWWQFAVGARDDTAEYAYTIPMTSFGYGLLVVRLRARD
ncbi:hypothetical protein [Streptomyces sp. NPDC020362]|uniref:hypothetical protein n=1 Tax=unclassified Streptomyces TaxID=2593676 RepID=UPI0034001F6E